MTQQIQRNWGMVVGGIGLIILGFICVFVPFPALMTIALLAGIGLLVVGVITIVSYFMNRQSYGLSGWSLVYGICDILLGALFVAHPLISAIDIGLLAGIFVCAYGIFSIYVAWRLRGVHGSGWAWFYAIVTLICGVCFFLWPTVFSYFLGFYMIFRGVGLATYGIAGIGAPPTPFYSRDRY